MKRWWFKQSYVIRFIIMGTLSAVALYVVIIITQRPSVMINLSRSLSFQVGLLVRADNSDPFEKDQWIAFHPPASALHQQTDILVKVITGIMGDEVKHQGGRVYVNESDIGKIQTQSSQGSVLHLGFTGIIPEDHYFVSTVHPKSFDSRYGEIGLVHSAQILGQVKVLW